MGRRLGVGVDIGATMIRVCVGDESGRILWHKSTKMSTPAKVDGYVRQVIERIREGIERPPNRKSLTGIGVASIGPLDIGRGGMANPSNLPYKFVPIVKPLKDEFGLNVSLMNDANAAVFGEKKFGAGKGHENLVYVTISTGIGGGVIVDGHLLVGKDGNAAEIGHLVVDPEGRLTCGCGKKGHWEAYCSGKNIPRLARLVAEDKTGVPGEAGRLLNVKRELIDAPVIFARASGGNRFANEVVERMGVLNAQAVSDLVDMFDPSLMIFGGGVALNNKEFILEPIRRLVPKYAVNRVPSFAITHLGDSVGLLGALALNFEE